MLSTRSANNLAISLRQPSITNPIKPQIPSPLGVPNNRSLSTHSFPAITKSRAFSSSGSSQIRDALKIFRLNHLVYRHVSSCTLHDQRHNIGRVKASSYRILTPPSPSSQPPWPQVLPGFASMMPTSTLSYLIEAVRLEEKIISQD